MIQNKEVFFQQSKNTLNEILNMLNEISELELKNLNAEETVLIIVDMVKGFAREGLLYSPRIEKLIPIIAEIIKKCRVLGIKIISIEEGHDENCIEFQYYPSHCIKDTSESSVVEELEELGIDYVFKKNSTNGFLEKDFQEWLQNNMDIENFIIVGDCTDICIQQFSLTIKTYFNMLNKSKRIIIPENAVDTFDVGIHNGDLMHVISLYNMKSNGIEIVKSIN